MEDCPLCAWLSWQFHRESPKMNKRGGSKPYPFLDHPPFAWSILKEDLPPRLSSQRHSQNLDPCPRQIRKRGRTLKPCPRPCRVPQCVFVLCFRQLRRVESNRCHIGFNNFTQQEEPPSFRSSSFAPTHTHSEYANHAGPLCFSSTLRGHKRRVQVSLKFTRLHIEGTCFKHL